MHLNRPRRGVHAWGVPTPVQRQALSVHCGRLSPGLFLTPISLFSSEVQKGELLMKHTLGCNGKIRQPSLQNSARARPCWGGLARCGLCLSPHMLKALGKEPFVRDGGSNSSLNHTFL